jgi:modulator of FtsH protease HflC
MIRVVLAVVVLLLVLLSQSVFLVTEGEQALVFQLGKHERTIREQGLYYRIPLIQEVRTLASKVLSADARSADEYMTMDKKRLIVDTVSRWKIEDPLLFYQTVRDYHGALMRLNAIIFGSLRQEIGNYNFRDFIREKREHIMRKVATGTAEQARRMGISIIDVRIKRVDLPEEVQASVFARMKAERERIAKRYRAEGDQQAREIRAKADKDREIILAEAYKQSQTLRGEGDAEATAIYASAYSKDAEFFSFLRRLEVYKNVLPHDTSILLRPDTELMKYLESPYGSAGPEGAAKSSGPLK